MDVQLPTTTSDAPVVIDVEVAGPANDPLDHQEIDLLTITTPAENSTGANKFNKINDQVNIVGENPTSKEEKLKTHYYIENTTENDTNQAKIDETEDKIEKLKENTPEVTEAALVVPSVATLDATQTSATGGFDGMGESCTSGTIVFNRLVSRRTQFATLIFSFVFLQMGYLDGYLGVTNESNDESVVVTQAQHVSLAHYNLVFALIIISRCWQTLMMSTLIR